MDWNKINEIHKIIANEARKQDGAAWKASASEIQSQYNEMPFWILLYEDSNLQVAHDLFREIIGPYIEVSNPVKCTVAYLIVVNGEKIQIDYMEGEDEILNNKQPMGCRPTSMGLGDFAIFKGMDSARL